MEFGEMKRNTSNWSNFCILLSRAGLSVSAGLSCFYNRIANHLKETLISKIWNCYTRDK